jgi:two-component system sensor histidine kinase BaeS
LHDILLPLFMADTDEGMKIRLAYKFFMAFLLTSLAIIALMTGIMRHFGKKNFEAFVDRMEAERLNVMSEVFEDIYRERMSWDVLRNNPREFSRLTQLNFPGPVPDRHPGRGCQGSPFGGMDTPPVDRPGGPRSPLPGPPPHMRLGLSLFDENKQPVAGKAQTARDHTLKALTVDGRTVGWLGLEMRRDFRDPVQESFLRQQTQAFLFTALGALIVSAIVSYLLSRHLLRPVEKLATGANALASKKFSTRIEVATGDELEQLAQDFNRMAQALERNEDLRRRWVSDIAHELRTPLAIMRGEIEAIQDGVREANSETLKSVHTEIMLLGSLVNDLHELSVADSGTFAMKMEPVDVHATLRETVKVFVPRFSSAGVDIDLDREPGVPQMVSADRERLIQVFSNILENSLRYTEAPGRLRIVHETMDGSVRISFEDSSPGVPDEALERLFDRLYRVEGSRNRRQGGTGLGLAICRSMVEGFNGEIRAYHSSLGGVRIEITLPLMPPAGRGGHRA